MPGCHVVSRRRLEERLRLLFDAQLDRWRVLDVRPNLHALAAFLDAVKD